MHGQQSQKRYPDFPGPSRLLQIIWWVPKLFPGRPRSVFPPRCLLVGHAWNSSPEVHPGGIPNRCPTPLTSAGQLSYQPWLPHRDRAAIQRKLISADSLRNPVLSVVTQSSRSVTALLQLLPCSACPSCTSSSPHWTRPTIPTSCPELCKTYYGWGPDGTKLDPVMWCWILGNTHQLKDSLWV